MKSRSMSGYRRVAAPIAIALLMLACQGCVRVEVGGESRPTLGEELRALEHAYRDGVISDDQLRRGKRLLFETLIR